jgi:four helix bundle protein
MSLQTLEILGMDNVSDGIIRQQVKRKDQEGVPQSPIFVSTYELLRWLVPRTTKFPREHRFGLAQKIAETAYRFQHRLLEAVKEPDTRRRAAFLRAADVDLAELRILLRLSLDLGLLKASSYGHVAALTDEAGRLLGGWMRKL